MAAVRPALVSLERRGWPGGTMVRLERKTMFGTTKGYSRAGWAVARYSYPWKDADVAATVYLMSDGQLTQQGSGTTVLLESHAIEYIVAANGIWEHFPLNAVKRGLERLAEAGDEA